MIEEYLELLKNLNIEEFQGVCLDKVLFDECVYAKKKNKFASVKRAFLSIFEMNTNFDYFDQKSSLLLLTRDFHRNDHNAYWSEITALFDNYNEIRINYLESKQKLKHINLWNVFRDTYLLNFTHY